MYAVVSRLLAVLVVMTACTSATRAEAPVSLEIVMEPGLPLDSPRQWMGMLQSLGLSNLTVRGGEKGDRAEIKRSGSDKQPSYSVKGIVTGAGELHLPGGRFRLGDKTGVQNWLAKLRDGGEDGVTAKKMKYGLTSLQLKEVHDDLKRRVDFSTKDKRTSDVVRDLASKLNVEVAVDDSASAVLESEETTADEFQGLSCGTVLAAVLRPHGCVFTPEKKLGEKLHYLVADSSSVAEPWPVGWEPDRKPGDLSPGFFKFLNVEVTDFALTDAMSAIAKRAELPLVYDYNAMARHRIEPAKIKVSAPKGKSSYSVLTGRLLSQAKLKWEMRIDEAEQPFLWITTFAK